MSDDHLLDELLQQDRVLISAELHLANGSFFQPTGFPDIGACVYTDGTGKRRCLVESEQSMANRLEAVCMKSPGVWREPFAGRLPVIRVEDKRSRLLATNLTEPHRIASSYVLEGAIKDASNGTTLQAKLKEHLSLDGKTWPVDGREKLMQAVFALDPAAILHGFQFMQWEAVGLRAARLLHSRLEATLADDSEVHYGLVKVDLRCRPVGDRIHRRSSRADYNQRGAKAPSEHGLDRLCVVADARSSPACSSPGRRVREAPACRSGALRVVPPRSDTSIGARTSGTRDPRSGRYELRGQDWRTVPPAHWPRG